MGIDLNCIHKNCGFTGKQCFCYRRELLDALRRFLKKNLETLQEETLQQVKSEQEKSLQEASLLLKFINWLYRDDEDDKDKVLEMEKKDRDSAIELLKKKELDGLFVWINLEEEDVIRPYQAQSFIKAYKIIKDYMKGDFLDLSILLHAARGHTLQCW